MPIKQDAAMAGDTVCQARLVFVNVQSRGLRTNVCSIINSIPQACKYAHKFLTKLIRPIFCNEKTDHRYYNPAWEGFGKIKY